MDFLFSLQVVRQVNGQEVIMQRWGRGWWRLFHLPFVPVACETLFPLLLMTPLGTPQTHSLSVSRRVCKCSAQGTCVKLEFVPKKSDWTLGNGYSLCLCHLAPPPLLSALRLGFCHWQPSNPKWYIPIHVSQNLVEWSLGYPQGNYRQERFKQE